MVSKILSVKNHQKNKASESTCITARVADGMTHFSVDSALVWHFFMEKTEIFKDVIGYEGSYQVSNLGRVKSLERLVRGGTSYRTVKEKILKRNRSNTGYLNVTLSLNGKTKTR